MFQLPRLPKKTSAIALASVLVFGLAGCVPEAVNPPSSSPSSSSTTESATTDTPHGYVAGAKEMTEAQLTLYYATAGATELNRVSLLTEETSKMAVAGGFDDLSTDGRFVFALKPNRVEIIDSGVWTHIHGDHNHYYLAPEREVGVVQLAGVELSRVISDGSNTTIGGGNSLLVLDRNALGQGSITELAKIDSGTSINPFAIAYRNNIVFAADGSNTLEFLKPDGSVLKTFDTACVDYSDLGYLYNGIVVACGRELVLISQNVGDEYAKTLSYPNAVVTSDWQVDSRAHSNAFVAWNKAGLLLGDATIAEAVFIAQENIVQATRSGLDGVTVVLTEDGKLHSYDRDGNLAESKEFLSALAAESATLLMRDGRAYLSDTQNSVIYEIDYRDNLRIAREFKTEVRPDFLMLVG